MTSPLKFVQCSNSICLIIHSTTTLASDYTSTTWIFYAMHNFKPSLKVKVHNSASTLIVIPIDLEKLVTHLVSKLSFKSIVYMYCTSVCISTYVFFFFFIFYANIFKKIKIVNIIKGIYVYHIYHIPYIINFASCATLFFPFSFLDSKN